MGYFGGIRLFYVSLKKLSLPDKQITCNYFWWFGKEPQLPDPGEEIFRRSRSQMFLKYLFLKISHWSLENNFQKTCNFIKETPTQVFSYGCEIFKNSFFNRTPPVAASALFWRENWSFWNFPGWAIQWISKHCKYLNQ